MCLVEVEKAPKPVNNKIIIELPIKIIKIKMQAKTRLEDYF